MRIKVEDLEPAALQRLLYLSMGTRATDRSAYDDGGTHLQGPELCFEKEFDKFCMRHPAWSHGWSDAWLFWQHPPYNELDRRFLVLRAQIHGPCWMLAPSVLLHYKQAGSLLVSDVKTVDVAKYIYDFSSSKFLENNILHDEGGSSKNFLRTLAGHVETDSLVLPKFSQPMRSITSAAIADFVREYGPGLVSCFKCDEWFFARKSESYLEVNEGKVVGLHSMVLIGYRKQGDEYVFLLQNWWRDNYFIEVSESYLAHAGAEIVFITSPVEGIRNDIPVVDSAYAETIADGGESFQEEL